MADRVSSEWQELKYCRKVCDLLGIGSAVAESGKKNVAHAHLHNNGLVTRYVLQVIQYMQESEALTPS